MHIQTYVIHTPEHTLLVDTGVGNHKPRPQRPAWDQYEGTYLDDLGRLGARPEAVDFVICTHLHIDHVGWNIQFIDGKWVPTFPNATYLFVGDEWEFWRSQHAAQAVALEVDPTPWTWPVGDDMGWLTGREKGGMIYESKMIIVIIKSGGTHWRR